MGSDYLFPEVTTAHEEGSMAWKDAAAELGTGRLVSRLTALKATMKKRDFKRLVATTVAQVLQAHPDVGRRKARRWARKATGTRPGKIGKKVAAAQASKAAAEAAGVASLTASATRSADIVSKRRAASRRPRVARTDGVRQESEAEVT
jgi:hypothetical protein